MFTYSMPLMIVKSFINIATIVITEQQSFTPKQLLCLLAELKHVKQEKA